MYVPAAVRNTLDACPLEVADMYPAFRSACFFAVALLGIRQRLCLITYRTDDGHLGSQTLGAALFRSMHVRFTNFFAGCGFSDRNRNLLAPLVKVGSCSQHTPCDPGQFVGERDTKLVVVLSGCGSFQPRAKAELMPVPRSHHDDLRGLDKKRA